MKEVNDMKHMICVSLLSLLLLLALSASAEDVRLQAAVPGNAGPEPGSAGTIELTVTLDSGSSSDEVTPAVMQNYSSVGPSAVPEPATLVLVGLGVLGVVGWRRLRKQG